MPEAPRVFFPIGFRNPFVVLFTWAWAYLSNNFQRLAFRRFRFNQRRDALIQRGQNSVALERQSQQIRVGHLLMPDQPRSGKSGRFGKWHLIRPECVVGGGGVGRSRLY